jgi:hypothetical protein
MVEKSEKRFTLLPSMNGRCFNYPMSDRSEFGPLILLIANYPTGDCHLIYICHGTVEKIKI